jgi:very-short-patch-repair endonuclease
VSKSQLEDRLCWQLTAAGLPAPVREFRFHPERRFRADLAYPAIKLLIEIEGGIWMRKSGHNTGSGITRDIEKGNLMTILGYRLIRVTSKMINSGKALDIIEEILSDETTIRDEQESQR